MNLTAALYDHLSGDATLVALLASYNGSPAIFTTDPAPGDAQKPYLVSAGHVVDLPFDTKTTQGREVMRDVRCYAEADGSAVVVEAIAERVRALLHRQELVVSGFRWLVSSVTGPVAADEGGAYGRIVTVTCKLMED
jgi:hypothetical protein